MTPTGDPVRLFPKGDLRPTLMQAIADRWSELPGACATVSEIASRWRLDRSTCEQMLAELVDRGTITLREDGVYELVKGNQSPGREAPL